MDSQECWLCLAGSGCLPGSPSKKLPCIIIHGVFRGSEDSPTYFIHPTGASNSTIRTGIWFGTDRLGWAARATCLPACHATCLPATPPAATPAAARHTLLPAAARTHAHARRRVTHKIYAFSHHRARARILHAATWSLSGSSLNSMRRPPLLPCLFSLLLLPHLPVSTLYKSSLTSLLCHHLAMPPSPPPIHVSGSSYLYPPFYLSLSSPLHAFYMLLSPSLLLLSICVATYYMPFYAVVDDGVTTAAAPTCGA